MSEQGDSREQHELDQAIGRILSSRTFARSDQLKRLLQHLCDAVKSGDTSLLSEMSIGVMALKRKDFDPKTDTIVRSEMVRLRRKLEEFYTSEGHSEHFRVTLDRYSYRLGLRISSPPQEPPVAPQSPAAFYRGMAWGAAGMLLLALLAALVAHAANRDARVAASITGHPLWKDFSRGPVTVVVGSPLFFRHNNGFERNWHLNFPSDLRFAKGVLANWPAAPVWDKWAAFEDVGGAVALDRFLRNLNADATFVSAHEVSFASLAKAKTIILGHPRFAPLLVDLLASQNFQAPPPNDPVRGSYTGFFNANPKNGEPSVFRPANAPAGEDARDQFLQSIDESDPDFALISSIHLKYGGTALSIFGNRTPTTSILIRYLSNAQFLNELSRRVFDDVHGVYRSAQIVVRVDYNKGRPTGVVYLTHRVIQN